MLDINAIYKTTDFGHLKGFPAYVVAARENLAPIPFEQTTEPLLDELARFFPKQVRSTRQILSASTALVNPVESLGVAPVVPIARGRGPSNPNYTPG